MKHTFLITLFLVSSQLIGQNFQGKATYRFNNSYADVDWSKKDLSVADTRMWKSKLSEASRTSFELRFTLTESHWQEIESLSIEGGKKDYDWNEAKDGLLYKNIADLQYLLETEVFDKAFLVEDKLRLPQWELQDETKTIGTYAVQKAVWKIKKEVMVFGEEEPQIQTSEVTAWFCPEIPISNGPKMYWGLPGLILEIQDGSLTYICEKIELNTEEIKLKKPTKGQKVSNSQLQKIIEDKSEEVLKKYNKWRKKG